MHACHGFPQPRRVLVAGFVEHDDCLVGDLGQPTPRDRAQAGMQQINRSRRDDNRNTRRR